MTTMQTRPSIHKMLTGTEDPASYPLVFIAYLRATMEETAGKFDSASLTTRSRVATELAKFELEAWKLTNSTPTLQTSSVFFTLANLCQYFDGIFSDVSQKRPFDYFNEAKNLAASVLQDIAPEDPGIRLALFKMLTNRKVSNEVWVIFFKSLFLREDIELSMFEEECPTSAIHALTQSGVTSVSQFLIHTPQKLQELTGLEPEILDSIITEIQRGVDDFYEMSLPSTPEAVFETLMKRL